jgi:NodT family efflux transporter outer membrane factor (OMF) lipoprotein
MKSHSPRARTLALAALAVAAGCAVGPDHQEPEVPLPEAWSQPLGEGVSPGLAADPRWWLALGDPILNDLVARARAHNLTLLAATARIAEARALHGAAKGGLFPDVDATASYTRINISDNGNPFGVGTASLPPFDFWSAGFDASWELDLFGGVRRAMEAASADIDAAIEDRNSVLVTLAGDVAANYVQLRTLQYRIRFAEENARLQAESARITEDRHRAGAVSQLDVAQARSNLHRTRAAIPLLRDGVVRNMNRLAVLMGENPRDLAAELGPEPPAGSPPSMTVDLPADLIRNRPDIRHAEREVAAQSARIGVAKAELYPRFSLLGTFTFDTTQFKKWFTGDSIAYRVGPDLRWNILDFGRTRSVIAAEEARWQESVLRYRLTVIEAIGEVENALSAGARAREAAAELGQALTAAQDAARTAEVQYRQGATGFQSLLDAQRFLAEIQDRHAEVRGDVYIAWIALQKALGVGWREPEAPPADEPAGAASGAGVDGGRDGP